MKKHTAYISGHIDLTVDEFNLHYKTLIGDAIKRGDSIVVGDANGADKMSMYYLFIEEYTNVTVYHMFEYPRNNTGFRRKGGYRTDEERDSAMTNDSTYDIAWIRPGREKSGTAKNVKRRKNLTGDCCNGSNVLSESKSIGSIPVSPTKI